MAWQGIEGHDAIVQRFVAAQERGRIAGSYLFVGPPGVGKGTFALALAKSLTCQMPRPGLVACGVAAERVEVYAGGECEREEGSEEGAEEQAVWHGIGPRGQAADLWSRFSGAAGWRSSRFG